MKIFNAFYKDVDNNIIFVLFVQFQGVNIKKKNVIAIYSFLTVHCSELN